MVVEEELGAGLDRQLQVPFRLPDQVPEPAELSEAGGLRPGVRHRRTVYVRLSRATRGYGQVMFIGGGLLLVILIVIVLVLLLR